MRITDGIRTVDITMHIWEHESLSPDWSLDFFEAGSLSYDHDYDTYIVEDVDYCIAQAVDWMEQQGDFRSYGYPDTLQRYVFVDEICI